MQIIKTGLLKKTGISILAAVLIKLLFFRLDEFLNVDLIFITLIVAIVWEGNLRIDAQLNKRYSWLTNPKKRILYQITACTIYTANTLFFTMYLIHQVKFGDGELINPKMREMFIPSLLLAFGILASTIGIQFFRSWKHSLVDVEKYKTESAVAQLQNLKNQLNPHFLFNNLSVLSSLVYKSQDKAVEFINELSKVYRYILENNNSEVVPLRYEIEFLNHYIYLLKIRFEESVIFTVKIDETKNDFYLPPMCLQMLVENTIQHNEASMANPLRVSIYTDTETLVIENTVLQRNDLIESSKTGIQNIESRYSFFTDKKVIVINDGKYYKVILPLLGKV